MVWLTWLTFFIPGPRDQPRLVVGTEKKGETDGSEVLVNVAERTEVPVPDRDVHLRFVRTQKKPPAGGNEGRAGPIFQGSKAAERAVATSPSNLER